MTLNGGGSAVQDIIDKTNRVENITTDIEKQVACIEKRIEGEIEHKQTLQKSK